MRSAIVMLGGLGVGRGKSFDVDTAVNVMNALLVLLRGIFKVAFVDPNEADKDKSSEDFANDIIIPDDHFDIETDFERIDALYKQLGEVLTELQHGELAPPPGMTYQNYATEVNELLTKVAWIRELLADKLS